MHPALALRTAFPTLPPRAAFCLSPPLPLTSCCIPCLPYLLCSACPLGCSGVPPACSGWDLPPLAAPWARTGACAEIWPGSPARGVLGELGRPGDAACGCYTVSAGLPHGPTWACPPAQTTAASSRRRRHAYRLRLGMWSCALPLLLTCPGRDDFLFRTVSPPPRTGVCSSSQVPACSLGLPPPGTGAPAWRVAGALSLPVGFVSLSFGSPQLGLPEVLGAASAVGSRRSTRSARRRGRAASAAATEEESVPGPLQPPAVRCLRGAWADGLVAQPQPYVQSGCNSRHHPTCALRRVLHPPLS